VRSSSSISVIMATFNKARFLDLTLASYRTQSYRGFEIVVVDDGSTDDTRQVVAHHRRHLDICYRRQSHAGRAAARNTAQKAAAGDLLVFSDDDRIVGRSFLAEHLAAQARATTPTFVLGWSHGIVTRIERSLVGPLYPVLWRTLGRAGRRESPNAFALVTAAELLARCERVVDRLRTTDADWEWKVSPAVGQFGDELAGLEIPWFLGNTGNLSVSAALVRAAGGFDAAYTGYGMEDTDLCYGLARAGARGRVARRAANYHQLHPVPSDRPAEMRASLRYFVDKHRTVEAWLFALWFCGAVDLAAANRIVRRDRRLAGRDGRGRARLIARLRAQAERLIGGGRDRIQSTGRRS
jgi:GT2 family glycosyltransferase